MKYPFSTLLSALTLLVLSSVSLAAEMVNINKADAAAISQSLEGIGPIKAEAIVSYRKKNGRFGSIDDLKNVDGIGPALIKNNKRYLSLSKGAVKGDAKTYAAAKKAALASKSKKKTKKKTVAKKPAKKKPVKKKKPVSEKPVKKADKKKPVKKKKKKKKKPAS